MRAIIRMGLLATAGLLAGVAFAASAPATDDGSARVISIPARSGTVSERITLALDKAAIVQLNTDARDVLVSNPEIVDAVVRTPRRIFLLAQKTGQTNAFFFDAAGHQILSLDIRVEKDVADLSSLLHANLPGSAIHVSALNDSVILTGSVTSSQQAARAQDLANRFAGAADKVVNMLQISAGDQVMLKVRVAEMDRNIAKQFGVDLSSAMTAAGVPIVASTSNPFGLVGHALSDLSRTQVGSVCAGAFSPNVSTSTTSTLTNGTNIQNITSTNPLLQEPGVVNGLTTLGSVAQTITSSAPCSSPNNLQGVVKALEQVGLVHILAEPNLTAVSGETAKFLAGGEFPVPSGRDNQGNVSVQFKQFGVGLSFTPVVLGPGRISVQLSTEVSELSSSGAITLQGTTTTDASGNSVTTGGLSIPALSVRRAETTVELPSGGSFAIAGLMQHTTKQVLDAFPGLKDMPVLGALFRSRDFENDETELVVLVSAYLVKPGQEQQFTTPTDGYQTATDPETILLGRMNAVYKKGDAKPVKPADQGPVGFIVQ
jgi:pilus assembly protein CpaC